jgi:glycosyltransferase involved in cell wall biosynthesis
VSPRDSFISEADNGIGDAFNKGLGLARGDWILFMNAGDVFAGPDALADLAAAWDGQARWIAGRAQVVQADGRPVFIRRDPPFADPRDLVVRGNRLFHQAVLAQRSLFVELGGFDAALRIAMDYDLWVRWICAGHAPQLISTEICQFRLGGASGDIARRLHEERTVRARSGLANPPLVEARLALVARLKTWTPAWLRLPLLYRLKERLRW